MGVMATAGNILLADAMTASTKLGSCCSAVVVMMKKALPDAAKHALW